jgi:hypothetical protein
MGGQHGAVRYMGRFIQNKTPGGVQVEVRSQQRKCPTIYENPPCRLLDVLIMLFKSWFGRSECWN